MKIDTNTKPTTLEIELTERMKRSPGESEVRRRIPTLSPDYVRTPLPPATGTALADKPGLFARVRARITRRP